MSLINDKYTHIVMNKRHYVSLFLLFGIQFPEVLRV